MNHCFKKLFAKVLFPLFMLLTGCNSEGAFSDSKEPSVPRIKLERINIAASPITILGVSELTLAKGNQQLFEAVGYYSDGSSRMLADLNFSDWHTSSPDVRRFDKPGELIGVEVGNTTLTATKDGVTSNKVDVNVCSNFADACIDFFDTGSGKLFTNPPSLAFLDSIGGSPTDCTHYENRSYGPIGLFYVFNWDNANTLCTTYSTKSLGGRTNLRLATKDELKTELYDTYGNMFEARGWPIGGIYWSATSIDSRYYHMNFVYGSVGTYNKETALYASCVSNP